MSRSQGGVNLDVVFRKIGDLKEPIFCCGLADETFIQLNLRKLGLVLARKRVGRSPAKDSFLLRNRVKCADLGSGVASQMADDLCTELD